MPLLHIEHPEDTILTGDLSVLDAFTTENNYSVKIDGSPAVVWGINPANGKFFVGTKSVFNKKTPKINYTVEDICRNHPQFELQSILIRCLHHLPHTDKIYQGDFIGYGGYRDYKPNAISYTLSEVTTGAIVIAPHTVYAGADLKTMTPYPLREKLEYEGVDFIQPDAWISDVGSTMDIDFMVGFAKQMATLVDFATEKEAKQLKIDLNAYIRDGDEVVAEEFSNYQLIRLWLLVKRIKEEFMLRMRDNFDAECFLGQSYISGEGYVMHGFNGTYKLVDRETFSRYNFNIIRS